ncbi:MAG: MCE family protein [Nitrospiraceae bacterium]|nr:MAG: MCE family protein [Nitrospiraceae bacterium]
MYDYRKHIRWASIKVGIITTVSAAIVFLAIMFAGNIQDFISPKVSIYTTFDDVKGLREGSPVWFTGVEIGSVESIEFTPYRKILVRLSISAETLKYLKKDSHAAILTLGLLGDKYIEVTPGSQDEEPIEAGFSIAGVQQVEIQDIFESSKDSIAKLTSFMEMLESTIAKIERGEGTVAKLLNDPSVYNNMKSTTAELSKLIRKMESGEGTLGKLVSEDALYKDVSSAVSEVRLFAKSLKESEGTLTKIIDDPALYNRFQKASESLDAFTQKLAYSKGTVNKLLEDETLYNNVNDVSVKVNTILDKIDKGHGLMGSLVTDDELSKELKSTLQEMNVLIKDIEAHPHRYFKFSIF